MTWISLPEHGDLLALHKVYPKLAIQFYIHPHNLETNWPTLVIMLQQHQTMVSSSQHVDKIMMS